MIIFLLELVKVLIAAGHLCFTSCNAAGELERRQTKPREQLRATQRGTILTENNCENILYQRKYSCTMSIIWEVLLSHNIYSRNFCVNSLPKWHWPSVFFMHFNIHKVTEVTLRQNGKKQWKGNDCPRQVGRSLFLSKIILRSFQSQTHHLVVQVAEGKGGGGGGHVLQDEGQATLFGQWMWQRSDVWDVQTTGGIRFWEMRGSDLHSQVIRDISKSVTAIQNAGLGEFRIRDLNDHINKLLREKKHWENRLRELGGKSYSSKGAKMLDREGKEVPGNRGYKYFGAARDLPGVRELFESDAPKEVRTQKEMN